jgi:hypothetical protein
MSMEMAARPLHAYGSEAEISALVEGFRRRTLPHAAWTHQAHLTVGLWHVLNRPAGRVLDELREGISRYNESVGTANTDSGGYHETITAFYVWAIGRFVREAGPGHSPLELANRLIASRYATEMFPFEHYSRERLLSVAARRAWVEPDLKALD